MSIKSDFDAHYKRLVEVCQDLETCYKDFKADYDEMGEYFEGPFATVIEKILEYHLEILKSILDGFDELTPKVKSEATKFQNKMEELNKLRQEEALSGEKEGVLDYLSGGFELLDALWDDLWDDEYSAIENQ